MTIAPQLPGRASAAPAAPDQPSGGHRRLPLIGRLEWVAALAVTAAAVVLHIVRAMRAGPLWRDEVNTLAVATMPTYGDLWSAMSFTRPPVLPYVIVRAGPPWEAPPSRMPVGERLPP